jgi:hypothetical protein
LWSIKESAVPGPSVPIYIDSEHKALETVEAALAKTPRLAKLLCYLVRHYFDGTTDRLTEFNIATEVFGRNPETFIASEDAIARVETHRLRKKLKLFYESEGRQHPVQISIPPGTYVPVFAHQKEKNTPLIESDGTSEILGGAVEPIVATDLAEMDPLSPTRDNTLHEDASTLQPPTVRSVSRHVSWRYALAAGIILCFLGLYAAVRLMNSRTLNASSLNPVAGSATSGEAQATSAATLTRAVGVAIPFRMIAGYSGPPQTDAAGFLWQSDQYHQRGWGLHRSAVFMPRASDPLIYQYGRAGDMDYDIPLQPGIYELHLYFMQPAETALGEDAENKAVFNVTLNGKILLENFDIVSDAMGRNTADERVFRDVSPAADGKLHLHLSTVVGTPSISAIALFHGALGRQLPIRIVTQPTPFTDQSGGRTRILLAADSSRIIARPQILRASICGPQSDMAISPMLSPSIRAMNIQSRSTSWRCSSELRSPVEAA